jgi:hypothetical protein
MDDQLLLLFPGLMFLLVGLGFLLARSDKSAREKDERRFGPLSAFNMGGWYLLAQNKYAKYTFVVFCLSLGLFLIVYGLSSVL